MGEGGIEKGDDGAWLLRCEQQKKTGGKNEIELS